MSNTSTSVAANKVGFNKQQMNLLKEFEITLKGDSPVLVKVSRFKNIPVLSDQLIGNTTNLPVAGKPYIYEPEDEEETPRAIVNLLAVRHGMREQMIQLIQAFAEGMDITRGDDTKTVPVVDIRVISSCLATHNIYPDAEGSFPQLPSAGMNVTAVVAKTIDEFSGEERVGIKSISLPEPVEAETLSLDLDALLG